jgi:hypothetical protein
MSEKENKRDCLQRAISALSNEGFRITDVKVNSLFDFGRCNFDTAASAGYITLTIIDRDLDSAVKRGESPSWREKENNI